MDDLDTLHTSLCALNDKTSSKKARVTAFAEWKNDKGHRVATAKLQGLQRGALGTIFEDDAKMLAALWDNREIICEAVTLLAARRKLDTELARIRAEGQETLDRLRTIRTGYLADSLNSDHDSGPPILGVLGVHDENPFHPESPEGRAWEETFGSAN